MRRAACALILWAVAAASSAQSFNLARLNHPTGVAWEWPEVDHEGRVVAVQRTHYLPGSPCASIGSTDVFVVSMRPGCGAKVFTRLTKDGISLDPSISSDGSKVAWRSYDVSATSNPNKIFIADADGTDVVQLQALNGTISRLELSPTGEWIVFLVTGRTSAGSTELIVLDVSSSAMTTLDSVSVAGDITLNRDACVSNLGMVIYTKRNGTYHDVYGRRVGFPLAELTTTPFADEKLASTSEAWTHKAFRRTVANVANVIGLYGSGPSEHAVTSNTSSSVLYNSVMAFRHEQNTPTGRILYESNQPFGSTNTDGTFELFRHSFGTPSTVQLTRFDASLYAPGRAFAGAALGGDGEALVFSDGPASLAGIACDVADRNAMSFWVASSPGDVVIDDNPVEALPPFELFGGVVAGDCYEVGVNQEECQFMVVNNADTERVFVVTGAWVSTNTYPSTGSSAPGPFTLQPGENAVVTLRMKNGNTGFEPHGTLDVFVLSPDVPMPDDESISFEF